MGAVRERRHLEVVRERGVGLVVGVEDRARLARLSDNIRQRKLRELRLRVGRQRARLLDFVGGHAGDLLGDRLASQMRAGSDDVLDRRRAPEHGERLAEPPRTRGLAPWRAARAWRAGRAGRAGRAAAACRRLPRQRVALLEIALERDGRLVDVAGHRDPRRAADLLFGVGGVDRRGREALGRLRRADDRAAFLDPLVRAKAGVGAARLARRRAELFEAFDRLARRPRQLVDHLEQDFDGHVRHGSTSIEPVEMARRARREPRDDGHRLRQQPFAAIGEAEADVVEDLVEV